MTDEVVIPSGDGPEPTEPELEDAVGGDEIDELDDTEPDIEEEEEPSA